RSSRARRRRARRCRGARGRHARRLHRDRPRAPARRAPRMTRLRLEVDEAALRHNALRLSAMLGRSELWAVVKADGYGHGAERAARAALAGGARRIAVATLDEGIALRAALGEGVPLLVLAPLEEGRGREAQGLEV